MNFEYVIFTSFARGYYNIKNSNFIQFPSLFPPPPPIVEKLNHIWKKGQREFSKFIWLSKTIFVFFRVRKLKSLRDFTVKRKGFFIHISGEPKNTYIEKYSCYLLPKCIWWCIVRDEQDWSTKCRKISVVCRFLWKFSFLWKTTVFFLLSKSNKNWDTICKIKNKMDLIHGNFSVFFVVLYFSRDFKVNYLGELGIKYAYK